MFQSVEIPVLEDVRSNAKKTVKSKSQKRKKAKKRTSKRKKTVSPFGDEVEREIDAEPFYDEELMTLEEFDEFKSILRDESDSDDDVVEKTLCEEEDDEAIFRKIAKKKTVAAAPEPRKKAKRRRQIDPTTCERDYSPEEVEFMNALDEYKRSSGRMFPTCSEILEVFLSLGYSKSAPAAAEKAEEIATPFETEPVVVMLASVQSEPVDCLTNAMEMCETTVTAEITERGPNEASFFTPEQSESENEPTAKKFPSTLPDLFENAPILPMEDSYPFRRSESETDFGSPFFV